MAAYVDECELDESAIEQELGLLQAIYIHELEVQCDESGHPSVLSVTLHPSTADNVDLQYVCLTLVFTITPEYPEVVPEIAIKNPRGISDDQLTCLYNQLQQLAVEQKGSAMLYELIEVVKEALTHNNTPYGQCVICLEDFKEGEAFTKTICYHYFHCDCLSRYIQHALDNPEDKDDKPNQNEDGKEQDKNEVVCAVCRDPITYDLEQLKSTPRRQTENVLYRPDKDLLELQKKMAALYKQQKEKGGIIDIEAESNKFLIDISVTPTLPMSTVIGSGSTDEKVIRTRTTASSPRTLPDPKAEKEEEQKSEKSKDRSSQGRHYHSEKRIDDGRRRKGPSYYREHEDRRENRGRGSSRPSSGRFGDRQYYRSDRRNWRDDEKRTVHNGLERSSNVRSSDDVKNVEGQNVKSSEKSPSTGQSSDNSEQESGVDSVPSKVKSESIVNGKLVEDDDMSHEKQRTKDRETDYRRRYDWRGNRRGERNYDQRDGTRFSSAKDQDGRQNKNGRLQKDSKDSHEQRNYDRRSGNQTCDRPGGASRDVKGGDISEQNRKQPRKSDQRQDRTYYHPRRENYNPRNRQRNDRWRNFDDKLEKSTDKGLADSGKDKFKKYQSEKDDVSSRQNYDKVPECEGGNSLKSSRQDSTKSHMDDVGTCANGGRQNTRNRRNYQQRNRTNAERDRSKYEKDFGRNKNIKGKETSISLDKESSEQHNEDQINHNHASCTKSELGVSTPKDDVSAQCDSQAAKEVKKTRPPPGLELPTTKVEVAQVKPPPGFEDFR